MRGERSNWLLHRGSHGVWSTLQKIIHVITSYSFFCNGRNFHMYPHEFPQKAFYCLHNWLNWLINHAINWFRDFMNQVLNYYGTALYWKFWHCFVIFLWAYYVWYLMYLRIPVTVNRWKSDFKSSKHSTFLYCPFLHKF